MTKELQMKVAKMSFLRSMAGIRLRARLRSSNILEELRLELLLHRVKRNQLRSFGHLFKMPPSCLPGRCFGHTHLVDPGQSQKTKERLYFVTGLGMPWRPQFYSFIFLFEKQSLLTKVSVLFFFCFFYLFISFYLL